MEQAFICTVWHFACAVLPLNLFSVQSLSLYEGHMWGKTRVWAEIQSSAAIWREEKGIQMLGQINSRPESSLEMVLLYRIKFQLHLSKALTA